MRGGATEASSRDGFLKTGFGRRERARALPVAYEQQALGRIRRGSRKRLHGGLSARTEGGA
jgi:hypothetical protein